ncbi:hypothetical protein Scep_008689 [Stephania cephalantha]|uniref:Uncharacterized protein n=1 Tax=Stephania cephalantha TaxID=152367 RepID=A0AAP0PMZ1_9MAGN
MTSEMFGLYMPRFLFISSSVTKPYINDPSKMVRTLQLDVSYDWQLELVHEREKELTQELTEVQRIRNDLLIGV